jgi:hypothetical protein
LVSIKAVQIVKLSDPPHLLCEDSDSIINCSSDQFAKNDSTESIISCRYPCKSTSNPKGLVEIKDDLRQLAALDCAVQVEIQILFRYATYLLAIGMSKSDLLD